MAQLNDIQQVYYSTYPIETSVRGGKGVAVFVQDQTTYPLDLKFLLTTVTPVLASTPVVNSRLVSLVSVTGILVGQILEIASATVSDVFMQATVLSINVGANTITIDTPINNVYSPATAILSISTQNLNVNGSVTPQVFSVQPVDAQKGDIVSVSFSIEDNANMDFETFGALPALTNGCVLRIKKSDGYYRNIYNFKTNQDLTVASYLHEFFENNGGGVRGFTSRMIFGGQDQHGVVIRLDAALGEELQMVVQDDLTGLLKFTVLAQGSEVQD